MNLDQEEIKNLVVEKITKSIIENELTEIVGGIEEQLKNKVNAEIETKFGAQAEKIINETIYSSVKNSLDREYHKTNAWGERLTETTSISKELTKLTSDYWSSGVSPRTGSPQSGHGSVSRAEFTMSKVCAQGFSETMKSHVNNATCTLKDGLRAQLAKEVNVMLDNLFKVTSLCDKGKTEDPWSV